MDHDIKSLQVFIEGEFRADRQARDQMHAENKAGNTSLWTEMVEIKAQTKLTNGRVTKIEIAVAVLQFVVFTVGGALILSGVQYLISRLGSHA